MPTSIDAVVSAVEKNDKVAVSSLLNAENAYDRVGIAKLVQERVKQDRVGNPSLPTIELSTATDFSKKELLLDLKANWQSIATQKSLYVANLLQDEYKRDYSFDRRPEKVYQTLDPSSGAVLTEDLSLPSGNTAHTDISHRSADQTTVKHRVWTEGTEETETYDKSNHLVVDDVQWQNSSGDLITRHEVDTYDQMTGKRTAKDLTMKDGTNHWDFDSAGRVLSQVSKDNTGAVTFSYEAQFDNVTGNMTYENRVDKGFSDLHTFDGETGKVLTEKETWSYGLTISQNYDYDKITHKQIWQERTTSDGDRYTVTSNSDGRPLVVDDHLKDGRSSHEDYSYDATGRLLVKNSKDFSGTVGREANKYDLTTGKLFYHTEDEHYKDGTSRHEEDKYDIATGELMSESFDEADGTHQKYRYAFDPQLTADRAKLLHITETLISKDGESHDYNYEYTYDRPKNQPKHQDILKILWKGSSPDGSWNEEEMSRINRMGIWHVSKALPGHGG